MRFWPFRDKDDDGKEPEAESEVARGPSMTGGTGSREVSELPGPWAAPAETAAPDGQSEAAAAAADAGAPAAGSSIDPGLEAQLLRAFECLEAAEFIQLEQVCAGLPGALGQTLLQAARSWNLRLVDLQKAVSKAIEQGARPLIASDRLAGDARMLDQQIVQLAALSEELAASVTEVAASADEAARGAREALEQVQAGMDRIQGALGGMVESGRAVEELRRHVQDLAGSVDPIRDVLGLIREVADQTNLLALNAAIEAARAGDSGRGFAVVADEVRRLAVGSGQAAEKIRTLLDDALGSIRQVASAAGEVEHAMDGAEQGIRSADDTLRGLSDVLQEQQQVLDRAKAALASSYEAARDGAAATQELVTQQLAVRAEELSRSAAEAQARVSRFRVA